jgi:hypothetical protein
MAALNVTSNKQNESFFGFFWVLGFGLGSCFFFAEFHIGLSVAVKYHVIFAKRDQEKV